MFTTTNSTWRIVSRRRFHIIFHLLGRTPSIDFGWDWHSERSQRVHAHPTSLLAGGAESNQTSHDCLSRAYIDRWMERGKLHYKFHIWQHEDWYIIILEARRRDYEIRSRCKEIRICIRACHLAKRSPHLFVGTSLCTRTITDISAIPTTISQYDILLNRQGS